MRGQPARGRDARGPAADDRHVELPCHAPTL
jgi:hypothetical protein